MLGHPGWNVRELDRGGEPGGRDVLDHRVGRGPVVTAGLRLQDSPVGEQPHGLHSRCRHVLRLAGRGCENRHDPEEVRGDGPVLHLLVLRVLRNRRSGSRARWWRRRGRAPGGRQSQPWSLTRALMLSSSNSRGMAKLRSRLVRPASGSRPCIPLSARGRDGGVSDPADSCRRRAERHRPHPGEARRPRADAATAGRRRQPSPANTSPITRPGTIQAVRSNPWPLGVARTFGPYWATSVSLIWSLVRHWAIRLRIRTRSPSAWGESDSARRVPQIVHITSSSTSGRLVCGVHAAAEFARTLRGDQRREPGEQGAAEPNAHDCARISGATAWWR